MGKCCPSPNCCLKCGKRHHTFLHLSSDALHPPSAEPRQDVPVVPTTRTTANTQATNSPAANTITSATYVTMPEATTSNSVLMTTAEVLLKWIKWSSNDRMGSTRSHIYNLLYHGKSRPTPPAAWAKTRNQH